DSELYIQFAITGLASGNYGNGHVYFIVVGFLYSFLGYERIIAQFFTVLLWLKTVILVYKTMGLYNIHKLVKYFALTIIDVLENFAIMSSILLRESIIIFLYVLSFYCFSKWFINKNYYYLTLAYIFGLLVSVFHSGTIILVIAYTIILILYDRGKNKFTFSYKSIIFAIAFGFIFWSLFQNYYDLFYTKFSNINEL